MVNVLGVIATRSQIETADACVPNVAAREAVTQCQSVLGIDLVVDAGIDPYTPLRCPRSIGERIDDRQRYRIENDRVDDGTVVDRVSAHVKKERSSLVDRATQAAAVFLQQERRLLLSVGIARVPEIM